MTAHKEQENRVPKLNKLISKVKPKLQLLNANQINIGVRMLTPDSVEATRIKLTVDSFYGSEKGSSE